MKLARPIVLVLSPPAKQKVDSETVQAGSRYGARRPVGATLGDVPAATS